MNRNSDIKFYVLEKIIYDSANRAFAESWNQMIIRPCKDDPNLYRSLLAGKGTGQITFEGAVCFQKAEETEDEFMLRAACQGINVSFVIGYVRTEGWNQYSVSVSDVDNGVTYELPLPKEIVKTDPELKKWA